MAKTVQFKLGGTLTLLEEEAGYCLVTVRYGAFTITARGNHMSYTLPSRMQVHAQVAYVDAAGNPAVVDGDVTWASSNDLIVAVTTNTADTTKVLIAGVGLAGQAQVTATADADLGDGVRTLVTTMDVEVIAGEAVAGTITPVGAAEPIS